MKTSLRKLLTAVIALVCAIQAHAGSITGNIQTASSGGVVNGTLTFTLNQVAYVSGSAQVVASGVNCYTSSAGAITGEPDPLVAPVLSVNLGSGTLAAGTYFVKYTIFDGTGESLPSPEASITLASPGTLIATPPAIQPPNATGWRVYISATTGTETRQSSLTGFGANYQQTAALAVGAALPVTNTSTCSIRFTDEMIPSTTYYTINMVNAGGSKIAGYPISQARFFGGTNGSVNVSTGWPVSFGGVIWPSPLMATPPGNAAQSIAGPLSLGSFGFTAGSGTFSGVVTVTGAFTAACPKNIGGIRYACNYVIGSTTCGVQEAYNDLPAFGGVIVIQSGNCSAAGWPVTIQKPVVIEGQGMGGPSDPGTNATIVAGSSLTNTSTGNSFFVISLGGGTSVEGVTFRDFAMIGNKTVGGATAGDCVDINGGSGSTQVRALSFENIQCNQPKGSGFVIKDNAFMINFLNVHVDQSGSHCYVLKDGVSSGVNSQIHFLQSTADLCGGNNASFNPGTADGWNISGATSRGIDMVASTAADSNNGINVAAGAVNTQLHVTNSDFETNTTCDVNLNDGFGHLLTGNTLLGTSVGARGLCTAFPVGAATQLTQFILIGNNINGHTVQDVTIGANTKNCVIFPQAQNNYSYSDASNNCVKLDSNNGGALTIAAASGFLPATNGTVPLGSAGLAWSDVFTFFVDATTYRPRATGHLLISDTAPTISAGFGTGASIVGSNGSASFAINVGTGGTANSGTIGLPTSFNGWNCDCEDQTTTSVTVNRCKQTGGSVSTAVIGNFNTTPAAAAWVASDIVVVKCLAR
ncbi:MAG TPA: hypothetical protein VGQ12_07760 [Candidatus Angelobacter sp.]|jgi:hypothetical protein|nr:hypothetical protein [Candidatus Angelobacter sp.]